jgi:hypothetical protein
LSFAWFGIMWGDLVARISSVHVANIVLVRRLLILASTSLGTTLMGISTLRSRRLIR